VNVVTFAITFIVIFMAFIVPSFDLVIDNLKQFCNSCIVRNFELADALLQN
jgi:hypothetical protein